MSYKRLKTSLFFCVTRYINILSWNIIEKKHVPWQNIAIYIIKYYKIKMGGEGKTDKASPLILIDYCQENGAKQLQLPNKKQILKKG